MADKKFTIELDFESKNLESIKQQLSSTISTIGKEGVKLGLDKTSISKMQGDVQKLSQSIVNSFNENTGKINWKNVNASLYKAGVSSKELESNLNKFGVSGQEAFKKISYAGLDFNQKLKDTNTWANKLSYTLGNTLNWRVSNAALNSFSSGIQSAYYFAKDLDTSLNNIRIVSGQTAEQMDKFAQQANKSAKVLGTSTLEYTDAALIYYQQGMNADDVKKMTDATQIAANITGESAEEMSTLLTAVMQGYGLAADDVMVVVDKLSAVGAKTAADFNELATAMAKVASMAKTAGVPIDELNAQIATIVSTTKESPETVGNSLKTIYARMLAFRNDAKGVQIDEEGESFSAPSVESALQKYNALAKTQISLFKTNKDGTKTLRDTGEVLNEIGDSWQDVDNNIAKFGLATALAGGRQQNRLIALFNNWEDYKKTVETSTNAAGTGLEQNAIRLESLQAHLNELKTSFEDLYMTVFDTDAMKTTIDGTSAIVDGFAEILKSAGGLPTILSAVAAILSRTVFQKPAAGLMTQDLKLDYGQTESEKTYSSKVAALQQMLPEPEFERIKKYSEQLDITREKLIQQQKAVDSINLSYKEVNASVAELDRLLKKSSTLTQKDVDLIISELNTIRNSGSLDLSEKNRSDIDEMKRMITKFSDGSITDLEQLEMEADLIKEKFINLNKVINQQQVKSVNAFGTGVKGASVSGMQTNITTDLKTYEAASDELSVYATNMDKALVATQKLQNGIMNSIMIFGSLGSVWSNETLPTSDKLIQSLGAMSTTLLMNTDTIAKTFAEQFGGEKSVSSLVRNLSIDLGKVGKDAGIVGANLNEKMSPVSKTLTVMKKSLGGVSTMFTKFGMVAGAATQVVGAGIKAIGMSLKALAMEVLPIIAVFAVFQLGVHLFDKMITTTEELSQAFDDATNAVTQTKESITGIEEELESITKRTKELNDLGKTRTDLENTELETLKSKTTELEIQLATQQAIAELEDKKAIESALDSMGAVGETSRYRTTTLSYGEKGSRQTPAKITEAEALQESIQKWNELKEARDSAIGESKQKYQDQMTEEAGTMATLSETVKKHANVIAVGSTAYNKLSKSEQKLVDEQWAAIEAYNEKILYIAQDTQNTQKSTEAIEGNTAATTSNIDAMTGIATISTDLGQLSTVTEEFSKNGYVAASSLSGLNTAFGTLAGESFEKFVSVAMDASSSTEDYQNALNDLVGAYLSNTTALGAMTEENKSLIITQLESLGVTNAAKIATVKLAQVQYTAALGALEFKKGFGNNIATLLQYANAAGLAAEQVELLATLQDLMDKRKDTKPGSKRRAFIDSKIKNITKTLKSDTTFEDLVVDYTPPPSSPSKSGKSAEDLEKERIDALDKAYKEKLELSKNYIEDRNYYEDWAKYGDDEASAYRRMLDYTKEYYAKGLVSAETYAESVRELEKSLVEANKKSYESRLANSENYIEKANFYNTWGEDNEVAAWERVKAYTQQAYNEGLIMYAEYIDQMAQISEKLYTAQKAAAKKLLEDQKTALETQRTDIESMVSAIGNYVDAQISQLEDEKAALEAANKAIEEQITLQELQANLASARAEKTKRVYYADKGWVWEADQEAIDAAEEALRDFEYQKEIDAIDARIDAWNEYKDAWSDIAEQYKSEQDTLILEEQLGADWEGEILDQRLDKLAEFKDTYAKTVTELTELQKKLDAFDETYKKTTSSSSGSSSGGSGSNYDSSGVSSYNGVSYNKNVDYQQRINDAESSGNASEAAKLKIVRAAKIAGEKLTGYATGGVNDETGIYKLHGNENAVETIFNAADGKKLFDFINKTPDIAATFARNLTQSIPSSYFNQTSSDLTNNRESSLSIAQMDVYTTDANDFMKQMKNLVTITGK